MDFENCNLIRERIKELGLTQSEIARKLNIDHRTIYRLLNGEDIRMGTMLDILSVLDLSLKVVAD